MIFIVQWYVHVCIWYLLYLYFLLCFGKYTTSSEFPWVFGGVAECTREGESVNVRAYWSYSYTLDGGGGRNRFHINESIEDVERPLLPLANFVAPTIMAFNTLFKCHKQSFIHLLLWRRDGCRSFRFQHSASTK